MLTVTVVDPERFTLKGKPVIYTGAFVELYNWKNRGQVHKIYGMIELEKMHALTAENPRNLNAHRIIEISSVLRSAHMVPRDQDKFVFYVNNYIDWDEFNQLYDLDWMEKGIRNADVLGHKLGPASTRAINNGLEVARKERQKKEEIKDRRKAEAMAVKRRRARGGMSSSSKEKDESDTGNNTNPDQAKDKYPLQL